MLVLNASISRQNFKTFSSSSGKLKADETVKALEDQKSFL